MDIKKLQQAISIIGSTKKLAEKLGITEQAVGRWKSKGAVPAARVLEIFHATGVTPHELRPDLYPNPTDGLPAEQQNTTKEN